MSNIDDLPNASNFGTGFNYAVWTPGTIVKLCNVPWNSDYRDIVKFDTKADLDIYLDDVSGPSVGISGMTLARAGDPIRLNLPFNACYIYNYLRVHNPSEPVTAHYVDQDGIPRTVTDTPKTLYYFISGVNYIAPNTTQITIELDVWQTFGFDIQFGNCYIEHGHIGVANENQFNNQGRDYLTILEGLEIGEEYCVNETFKAELNTTFKGSTGFPTNPIPWVVVGIAADVTIDPGDTTSPTLSLYAPSGLGPSSASGTENMPNGFDVLYFTSADAYMLFLANFAKTPWITQTIQFVTLVPPIELNDPANMIPVIIWDTTTNSPWPTPGPGVDALCYRYYNSATAPLGGIEHYTLPIRADFRDYASSHIPSRYSHLKKFLVYPYTLIELTTYNATPLILKPELIPSDDIDVEVYQHAAPPNPRWAIIPSHYNATGTSGGIDDGEYLDFATYISNFPQFTVMNNGYLQYLASNAAGIAYQERSANWGQQKAIQGANTSFENTLTENMNASQQAQYQRDANNARMRVQNAKAGVQILGDIGVAAATGGKSLFAGGATNLASQGEGIVERSLNNSINNNLITNSTWSNVEANAAIGNNNANYAKYAARGDYQNAIAGIHAQISNAKMTQPSVVGQMGGEAFFVALNNLWNVYAKLKQINPGMMSVIGEYWLRYGYSINRFGVIPTDLQVMSKFTYWKLKETYIISSRCPEIFKQVVRGIFEKGVTVWDNPSDIGNIDIGTNEPLTGISL